MEAGARVLYNFYTYKEAVRIFLDFSSDKWAGVVVFCVYSVLPIVTAISESNISVDSALVP